MEHFFAKQFGCVLRSPFCYFRSDYRRLKRFIAWFPIIWRDEDWDSAYLFEIMRFKISRIRQEMDKNQRHVGYEKNVRNMKVAEELLARFAFSSTFSNFYYELSEQLENAEKQGKCLCPEETWAFKPYESESGKHIGSELIDLSCNYCKDARVRWFKREDNKKQQDFDFLFWHLRKNVRKWWD